MHDISLFSWESIRQMARFVIGVLLSALAVAVVGTGIWFEVAQLINKISLLWQ